MAFILGGGGDSVHLSYKWVHIVYLQVMEHISNKTQPINKIDIS